MVSRQSTTVGRLIQWGLVLSLTGIGCAGGRGAFDGRSSQMISRLQFQNEQLRSDLEQARNESDRLITELDDSRLGQRELELKVEAIESRVGRSTNPGRPSNLGAGGAEDRVPLRKANEPSDRRAPFTQITNPSNPSSSRSSIFGRSSRPEQREDQPEPYLELPVTDGFFQSGRSSQPSRLDGSLPPPSRTEKQWSPVARRTTTRDSSRYR